ncbi:ABC transporter G family member 26 isoform X3 [Cryptomeria japonica]|uniref:ABC transporter G family member 26 isoform X3 n=1 Tax=Cryptomeria japonica TaxID=3369 RepID=UPI0027DA16C0|nr:ABC transporter G family member 26 isoform X3 [Cryptomeria japonica]
MQRQLKMTNNKTRDSKETELSSFGSREFDEEREAASGSAALPVSGALHIPETSSITYIPDITQFRSLSNGHRHSSYDIETTSSTPLPIFLKFEDVEYRVQNQKPPGIWNQLSNGRQIIGSSHNNQAYKSIVNGITGSIAPGQILALMGPSGSGKTTFLKIVGGRLQGDIKGNITYNDIPYNTALKRRIGYVTQDDILFPQLTVQESLVFAALLRLPNNMSRQQKLLRAETILADLGLERCRHTRVGGAFVRGISGGERKRTSIGFEILVDPSLLLLDEPTSGLDSTTATKLLQLMQRIAQYLQRMYITELEAQEKEALQRYGKAPDHWQSAVQVQKEWTTSWWEQFCVLSKRNFRERYRDYFDKLRFFQAIGVAVLLGFLWWKSKIETEAQLRDQVGLMFYICIFWTSSSLFGSVYVFPFEKNYLVKERRADMYRLSAYYLCSTLCDMMAHLLYPIIFMSILYFMAGFKRTVSSFLLTLLAVLLIVITGQGAGEFFGAAILSIKRVGTVASLMLLVFLLTGGYYVQHIPVFVRWIKHLSFLYYGFRLLLKVQYSADEMYDCLGEGGCKSLQSSPSMDTITLNGGVEEGWVLICMALAYRVCAYICLRRNITLSPSP